MQKIGFCPAVSLAAISEMSKKTKAWWCGGDQESREKLRSARGSWNNSPTKRPKVFKLVRKLHYTSPKALANLLSKSIYFAAGRVIWGGVGSRLAWAIREKTRTSSRSKVDRRDCAAHQPEEFSCGMIHHSTADFPSCIQNPSPTRPSQPPTLICNISEVTSGRSSVVTLQQPGLGVPVVSAG